MSLESPERNGIPDNDVLHKALQLFISSERNHQKTIQNEKDIRAFLKDAGIVLVSDVLVFTPVLGNSTVWNLFISTIGSVAINVNFFRNVFNNLAPSPTAIPERVNNDIKGLLDPEGKTVLLMNINKEEYELRLIKIDENSIVV